MSLRKRVSYFFAAVGALILAAGVLVEIATGFITKTNGLFDSLTPAWAKIRDLCEWTGACENEDPVLADDFIVAWDRKKE